MSWKIRDLLREAGLNLSPRHALVGAIATALLVALGIVTAWFATDALAQERTHRAEGGLVWVATPSTAESLDAARCDALTRQRGVGAAGGPLTGVTSDLRPFVAGRAQPTRAVTPSALDVWGVRGRAQVWVGSDLAATGQVIAGSTLVGDSGERVDVVGELPPVPVTLLRSHVVVVAPPAGRVTECWIVMEPGTYSLGPALVSAAFGDEAVRAAPFFQDRESSRTALEQWTLFAGRAPWLLAGVGLMLVCALMAWTRRSELAVYRTFGAGLAELWLMLAAETAIVIGVACSLAITTVLLSAKAYLPGVTGDVGLAVVDQIAAAGLVTLVLAPAASALVSRGNIAGQLKDR